MENKKMENEKKEEIFYIIWSNIQKYQYLHDLDEAKLGELLGVTDRTVFTYRKQPSKITLQQVQSFIEKTGVDINFLITP